MKAIVMHKLGDASMLSYGEMPDPVPGPGEFLVKLKAAAVNRRDLSLRERKSALTMLPLIPGTDGAGVIAGLGPGVKGWSVGQAIMINPALCWGKSPRRPGSDFRILGGPDHGTYAQMVNVPAENVYQKPENLTFSKAAACPVGMLTAWRALITLASIQPGIRLLIPGIGSGVATFALQIAKQAGAIVYVTSHSDEKLRLALTLGADGGANYERGTWQEEIWEMTDRQGVDVVLDSVGTPTFREGMALLTAGGRLVTFGATAGAQVELDLRLVYHRHINILGTTLGSPWEFEELLRPLASGAIKPVVNSIFPLTQASDAQRRFESGMHFGKIVLEIE